MCIYLHIFVFGNNYLIIHVGLLKKFRIAVNYLLQM
jgi:hypothetical protein